MRYFAPISFLADAEDVYTWCRMISDANGWVLPGYVQEFFNRQIPAVVSHIAELDLKSGRAAGYRDRGDDLEAERDRLRVRVAELESTLAYAQDRPSQNAPVSAPPAVPGGRDFHLRPQDVHGWNEVAPVEAGITEGPAIDPDTIDAELNGHEPTPFADGAA